MKMFIVHFWVEWMKSVPKRKESGDARKILVKTKCYNLQINWTKIESGASRTHQVLKLQLSILFCKLNAHVTWTCYPEYWFTSLSSKRLRRHHVLLLSFYILINISGAFTVIKVISTLFTNAIKLSQSTFMGPQTAHASIITHSSTMRQVGSFFKYWPNFLMCLR